LSAVRRKLLTAKGKEECQMVTSDATKPVRSDGLGIAFARRACPGFKIQDKREKSR